MKIHFHFEDSVLPFTVFFTSSCFFSRDGFIDQPEFTSGTMINNKRYSTKYPLLSDSIFDIFSAFPRLKTMDTISNELIINDSYYKEFDYSYILNILREPSLYNCEDKQAIRIIRYSGDQYWSDRIEIQDKGVVHVFSCTGLEEGRPLTYLFGKSFSRAEKYEKAQKKKAPF